MPGKYNRTLELEAGDIDTQGSLPSPGVIHSPASSQSESIGAAVNNSYSNHSRTMSNVSNESGSSGIPSAPSSSNKEVEIPTRNLRRASAPTSLVNPMQFVKTPESNLKKKAIEQIKLSEQVKKNKEVRIEETDWQSNLDHWKSRRKRLSCGQLSRQVERDETETTDTYTTKPSRSFKSLMEDRARIQQDLDATGGLDYKPQSGILSTTGLAMSMSSSTKSDTQSDTQSDTNELKMEPPTDAKAEGVFTAKVQLRGGVDASPTAIREVITKEVAPSRVKQADAQNGRSADAREQERVQKWIDSQNFMNRKTEMGKTMASPKSSEQQPAIEEEAIVVEHVSNKRGLQATGTDLNKQLEAVEKKLSLPKSLPPVSVTVDLKPHSKGDKNLKPLFVNTSSDRIESPSWNVSQTVKLSPKAGTSPVKSVPSPTRDRTKSLPAEPVKPIEVTVSLRPPPNAVSKSDWKKPEPKEFTLSKDELEPQAKVSNTSYVEKLISITQLPNYERGFGFSIKGGREFDLPIVVDSIMPDSAAGGSGLLVGDEILAINGEDVGSRPKNAVSFAIRQAVFTGQIELKIRRYPLPTQRQSSPDSEGLKLSELDNKPVKQEGLIADRRDKYLVSLEHDQIKDVDKKTYDPEQEPRVNIFAKLNKFENSTDDVSVEYKVSPTEMPGVAEIRRQFQQPKHELHASFDKSKLADDSSQVCGVNELKTRLLQKDQPAKKEFNKIELVEAEEDVSIPDISNRRSIFEKRGSSPSKAVNGHKYPEKIDIYSESVQDSVQIETEHTVRIHTAELNANNNNNNKQWNAAPLKISPRARDKSPLKISPRDQPPALERPAGQLSPKKHSTQLKIELSPRGMPVQEKRAEIGLLIVPDKDNQVKEKPTIIGTGARLLKTEESEESPPPLPPTEAPPLPPTGPPSSTDEDSPRKIEHYDWTVSSAVKRTPSLVSDQEKEERQTKRDEELRQRREKQRQSMFQWQINKANSDDTGPLSPRSDSSNVDQGVLVFNKDDKMKRSLDHLKLDEPDLDAHVKTVSLPSISLFDLEQEKLRKKTVEREEREQKEIQLLQEEYKKQQTKMREEEMKQREKEQKKIAEKQKDDPIQKKIMSEVHRYQMELEMSSDEEKEEEDRQKAIRKQEEEEDGRVSSRSRQNRENQRNVATEHKIEAEVKRAEVERRRAEERAKRLQEERLRLEEEEFGGGDFSHIQEQTRDLQCLQKQRLDAARDKYNMQPKPDFHDEDFTDLRPATNTHIVKAPVPQTIQANKNANWNDTRKPMNSEQQSANCVITPNEPIRRRDITKVNAAPKARLSDNWAKSDRGQPKRRTDVEPVKRSDILRRETSNPQEHWVVQEAERRRLADHNEKERLQKLRSRHSAPFIYNQSYVQDSKNKFEPAHRKDVSDRYKPEYKLGNSIPGPVKTTLIERTNGPKYPELNGDVIRESVHTASYSQNRKGSPEGERVITLSGKEKCGNCGHELGGGAAMTIEKLNLNFHIDCFRCCVCSIPLGNGLRGADVRVRHHKLHCQNCYSNDEAGLQYSAV